MCFFACCQGWGSHTPSAKEERDQGGQATASGDEDVDLLEIFRNSAASAPSVLGSTGTHGYIDVGDQTQVLLLG